MLRPKALTQVLNSGQHWRCSEHPVSADREAGWRALAWGSARLSEEGWEGCLGKGGGGRGQQLGESDGEPLLKRKPTC